MAATTTFKIGEITIHRVVEQEAPRWFAPGEQDLEPSPIEGSRTGRWQLATLDIG